MAEGPEDVAEFLRRLDGWEPTLVEEVVDYYLARAGFSCSDARVKKLIAAAAERFVSEVAREALQSARMHGSAGVADRRSRGGAAAAASEEGSAAATEGATLTIEDLSFALRQFGVDLHKPEYWADA